MSTTGMTPITTAESAPLGSIPYQSDKPAEKDPETGCPTSNDTDSALYTPATVERAAYGRLRGDATTIYAATLNTLG